MGARGPIPKHDDERRRRNVPADGELRRGARSTDVSVPPAKKSWHPAALRWYESLEQSGQADYYEPSDWAVAYMLAETMSRELRPRVVAVTKEGQVVKESVPISGASLTAILRGCAVLGATEGDRLRMRLELERAEPEGDTGGTVAWLGHARPSGTG